MIKDNVCMSNDEMKMTFVFYIKYFLTNSQVSFDQQTQPDMSIEQKQN